MKLLRVAVFERLKRDSSWNSLPGSADELFQYVESSHSQARRMLPYHIREVLWQLLTEGVLAPGFNSSNPDLPWFHLTELGRSILESEGPNPFDPEGYVAFVEQGVRNADATVLAYLAESLSTQRRGNVIASAVMLGIAAERVFLLVCESLHRALKDSKESKQLGDILDRFPIKPKLDWLKAKVEALQAAKTKGLPENVGLMVLAIYDLIRHQRNELGHPRETPPTLTRDEVLANIQIFVRYYESAERLRAFLANAQS